MIKLGLGDGGLCFGMRRGVYLIGLVWRYEAVCHWLMSVELPICQLDYRHCKQLSYHSA